jgi:hypothetical protein
MDSIVIASRFCGPPTSGNGGYSAGLVARELGGTAEVTLRKPPPLDRPLVVRTDANGVEVRDGDSLVAAARPAELELEVPPAVTFERALELSLNYAWLSGHAFPTCFVCGPERAAGDGLLIFPGADRNSEPVYAPWIPSADLAGRDGFVRSEIMWAALDCPGYFGAARPDHPKSLLGRITATIYAPLRAGDRAIAMGWLIGREGRKLHAGTALYGPDGVVRAKARQTWLVVG